MPKTRVLFLCIGNSARSQMAEAFLRRYADDYFEVYSAGFDAKEIHPFTYKVMEELGYDLKGHESKNLEQFVGKKHFGVVITVCNKAEEVCPTIPGVATRLYWPFEDPVSFQGSDEDKLEKFREVRDQIHNKIIEWLHERGILNE